MNDHEFERSVVGNVSRRVVRVPNPNCCSEAEYMCDDCKRAAAALVRNVAMSVQDLMPPAVQAGEDNILPLPGWDVPEAQDAAPVTNGVYVGDCLKLPDMTNEFLATNRDQQRNKQQRKAPATRNAPVSFEDDILPLPRIEG